MESGTKALLALSLKYGRNSYILRKDIAKQAGFSKQYNNAGLWPWFEKNANVVEEQKIQGQRAYRIKEEFFEAFHQALSCS